MSGYGERLSWPGTRLAAAALRAARETAGRRRRAVAERLGWSESKLGEIERAVTRVTPADALALAAELGADLGGLGLAELSGPELPDGEKK